MPIDVPSNAPSAFFSYCRADSDFALKLAEDLKAAGANVWIDQLDIEPGTPWDGAVEEALIKSPRMLVILSAVSVVSANVRDEITYALSHEKRVIPVLITDCDLPIRLSRLQHIDFRTDYARGLKLLLRSLGVEARPPDPSLDELAAEKAKAEQTELDRKAAEEKARQEENQRKLLATEKQQLEAQKRQSVAEWLRFEQERQRLAAEQAKLEEDRKQTAAEKARLEQLDRDRQAAEEKARQLQAEREREAAEKARQQEAARVANAQIPPQPTPPPFQETPVPTPAKFPTWGKVAAGVVAAVVVIWLLYLAFSTSKPPTAENPPPETQTSQSQPTNQSPAEQTQNIDASKANSTPAENTEALKPVEKVEPKPNNPPQTVKASTPSSTDSSRGLTSNPALSTDTPAASVPPGLSAEVAEHYRKAQSGSSDDMVDVGLAYENGKGAPQDYKKAVYWYRKAAGAGNSYGMLDIGKMYEGGRGGLPQDDRQVVYWYRKAAGAGNGQGMTDLGFMYANGRGGLPQDYQQALHWYHKATDAGDAYGMNELGRMYERGWGVQSDKQQAISWYRKAAQLGNQDAKTNLKRLGENP